MQIISCADMYIGNDCGVTHLAAATGTKTLAVFGPTDPALYKPIGPCVRVFNADIAGFTSSSAPAVSQAAEIVSSMLND
jgi:ADP-heptose:LPS heptosyltransferase